MGSVRPWQIVLFAAALIALGFGLYMSLGGSGKVDRADNVYLVDTVTGDFFVFKVSGRGGVTVPAIHPDTGERTLYRTYPTDDDQWELDARDLGQLEMIESLSDSFDLEARRVEPNDPEHPRKLTKEDFLRHLDG